MIAFKLKNRLPTRSNIFSKHYITINDIGLLDNEYFESEKRADIFGEKLFHELVKYSYSEIYEYLNMFSYSFSTDWWFGKLKLLIYVNGDGEIEIPKIQCNLEIDFLNWSNKYTIQEFCSAIDDIIKTHSYSWSKSSINCISSSSMSGISYSRFSFKDKNAKISNNIDDITCFLKEVVDKCYVSLNSKFQNKSLITEFQFPESIKASCVQYLSYFTQFIMDLGIECDTEIQEKSHITLFTVTPKSKYEALEHIKDALISYLNATKIEDFELDPLQKNDIAILQWQSNIYHLKSQLALSKALLQAKDATIEQLQLTNYLLKDGMRQGQPSDQRHEEDLIPDLLTVKKYEGKAFSINLPEILKRLKRTLNL